MERPNYSDQDFADTLEMEALIIKDAREKFERGELSGRKAEPLPKDETEALEESSRRDQSINHQARIRIGKRRSIYG